MISALQVLSVMVQSKRKMSELARQFEPAPQTLVNVRYAKGAADPLATDLVQSAIKDGEARLNGSGRIVVRASGTEPLIRVMAEGDDEKLVRKVAQSIAQAVKQATA